MKILLILDSMSIIFRAFYGTPRLSTKEGFPTNSIYTFTRLVLQLNDKFNCPYFLFTFDSGRETFRLKISSDYKANRAEIPEDLKIQIPECLKMINSLGCTVLQVSGYEADDLIAEALNLIYDEFDLIVIVTLDKDLMQLVTGSKVILYDPFKVITYSEQDVIRKYNLSPKQFPILLALTGDASDNVKGVPGIGLKLGSKIAKSFESIEELISELENPSGKLDSKIYENKELLLKNIELVYLTPKGNLLKKEDVLSAANKLSLTTEFFQFCEFFEFKSILRKYETKSASPSITRG